STGSGHYAGPVTGANQETVGRGLRFSADVTGTNWNLSRHGRAIQPAGVGGTDNTTPGIISVDGLVLSECEDDGTIPGNAGYGVLCFPGARFRVTNGDFSDVTYAVFYQNGDSQANIAFQNRVYDSSFTDVG